MNYKELVKVIDGVSREEFTDMVDAAMVKLTTVDSRILERRDVVGIDYEVRYSSPESFAVEVEVGMHWGRDKWTDEYTIEFSKKGDEYIYVVSSWTGMNSYSYVSGYGYDTNYDRWTVSVGEIRKALVREVQVIGRSHGIL